MKKLKLQPYYNFKMNEPFIFFHDAKISLLENNIKFEGVGKLEIVFTPQPSLEIHGNFQTAFKTTNFTEKCELNIDNRKVFGTLVNSEIFFGEIDTCREARKWLIDQSVHILGDEQTVCTEVCSHLFNFNNINMHSYIINDNEQQWIGDCINFNYEDWIIQIRPLPNTSEIINKLKYSKGYALTHIIILIKEDNKPFQSKDALALLIKVSDFFAFAKGALIACTFPVGLKNKKAVWKQLSVPAKEWVNCDSWFDCFRPQQLEELFPKFMEKRCDVNWGDAISSVLPWYFSANDFSNNIELNIIATQTALEKLSYEYAVNHKRLLTKNGFKDLWASDKFRLLFSSLSIPIEITNETPEIFNVYKKNSFKWLDAAHALTEIRNALVHPEHNKKGLINNLLTEALKLGLRYLELSILAICGYQGTYLNRLKKSNRVEQVPWVKNS